MFLDEDGKEKDGVCVCVCACVLECMFSYCVKFDFSSRCAGRPSGVYH